MDKARSCAIFVVVVVVLLLASFFSSQFSHECAVNQSPSLLSLLLSGPHKHVRHTQFLIHMHLRAFRKQVPLKPGPLTPHTPNILLSHKRHPANPDVA